ncbi:MAG: FMN-binding protein [Elusimicrobiota bacterium]
MSDRLKKQYPVKTPGQLWLREIMVILLIILAGKMMMLADRHIKDEENVKEILQSEEYIINTGRYTGTGKGFVDKISVEIVYEKNSQGEIIMTEINILDSSEIRNYWIIARDTVIREVLRRQDTSVDAVSGATESSHGLLEAIENARKKAYSGN